MPAKAGIQGECGACGFWTPAFAGVTKDKTIKGREGPMRLKDKVAIITGGGSGFGEGMARRFAAEGAAIVINDLKASGGQRVVDVLKQRGAKAMFIQGDVAQRPDVKALIARTLADFGRIDILV